MPDEPTPTPDEPKNDVTTAANLAGMDQVDQQPPRPGLSFTPGLEEIEGSKVPFADHNHVFGPQQAACDPVAAGLDTQYKPMTRADNRVINQTGEAASGPRTLLPEHPPADGALVQAPSDADSAKMPGPNASGKTKPVS